LPGRGEVCTPALEQEGLWSIGDLFIGNAEGVPDWAVGRELVPLLFERLERVPCMPLQEDSALLIRFFLKIITSLPIERSTIGRAHESHFETGAAVQQD